MKLYHNPLSPNVRRARLTAAYLGLDVEEVVLDFRKGEHKQPDYLKLNPNGAVPTLVDGDFVLTESRAIMQYLASRKPEVGLLPKDERGRADVTRWQFWDSSHFSPAVGTLLFEKMLKGMYGMGDADPAKVAEGLGNFRKYAGVLNGHLEGKQYIVGQGVTLADLNLASTLMYAQALELPLAEFPNVKAWFERITALPAWKKTDPNG
jgi:glutathione S-transferase